MKNRTYLKTALIVAAVFCTTYLSAQWTATTHPYLNATGGTVRVGTTVPPLGGYSALLTVGGSDVNMGTGTWANTIYSGGQSTFSTITAGGTHNYWHMFRGGTEVSNLFTSGGVSNPNMNVNARIGHLRSLTGDLIRLQLNYTRTPTINGFSSTTTGYLGLTNQQEFYTTAGNKGPYSKIHLAQEYAGTSASVFSPETGYRPWMQNGVTFTGNSGQAYIGHKYGNDDVSDLVFQWSDDAGTGATTDRLRFIFTSNTNSAPYGMGSTEGLEAMRMWPKADKEVNIGIGDFHEGGDDPTERLDIRSGNLRIRHLPFSQNEDASQEKVMVVRDDGIVKWRYANSLGGGGSDCEWDMPLGVGVANHVSTAFAASVDDCPDEAEAVGIGVDLSGTTPTAKFHVETDQFTNGASIKTSTTGTDVLGTHMITSGGSQFHTGLLVESVGGVDPTCVDIGPVDPDEPLHSEDNCATAGIRVDVTAQGRRSRGVWAYTTGATKRAVGGRFEARDAAERTWGVMGFTQNGTYRTIGVLGENYSAGSNQNFGTLGNSIGSGNTNYGAFGYACNASTNYGIYGETCTTGANDWAGWFQGNVTINGLGYLPSSVAIMSDASLKTNVQDLKDAGELIAKLQPKTYDFRVSEHPSIALPSEPQMGLIAQEVEEVLPHIVKEVVIPAKLDREGNMIAPSEKLKAVQYEALIPLLLAGHKEQQAIIEELKNEIEVLKGQLGQGAALGMDTPIGGANGTALRIAPNPFNERTMIAYTVNCACRVRLEVTTADGKPLRTLLDEQRAEGNYTFDWNTADIAPGMYFCTLLVDGKPTVKQAVKVTR